MCCFNSHLFLCCYHHTHNERCWKIGANRNNVRYCVLEIEKKNSSTFIFLFFVVEPSPRLDYCTLKQLLISSTFWNLLEEKKKNGTIFCLFVRRHFNFVSVQEHNLCARIQSQTKLLANKMRKHLARWCVGLENVQHFYKSKAKRWREIKETGEKWMK